MKKEVVIITTELHRRLQPGGPAHTSQFTAPFYWIPETHRHQPFTQQVEEEHVPNPTNKGWGWNNASYVKLPFSKSYHGSFGPKWNDIIKALENLRTLSLAWVNTDKATGQKLTAPIDCFIQVVGSYCGKAKHECNFKVIAEEVNLSRCLMDVLPGIIEHALKLPGRLEGPIPILKRGRSHTICLTRDLVCSLLANAFLCTFPEQDDGRNLPYFNFYQLFDASGDPGRTRVKQEKLMCILDYFFQMSQEPRTRPNSIITFERRCYTGKMNWAKSTEKLCHVSISANEKLEETKGMLQVDFANKQVGGGVLNEGAVQEEIRFCISPELICARLFTESLTHDEVLVITGTAQFSSYSGYSSTFRHAAFEANSSDGQQLDSVGRHYTQVVAMDALNFHPNGTHVQYKPEKIDRELHKCNVAFTQGNHSTSVATGNWGCGVFNGDPQLKFLVQWMAASVHRRDSLLFHANDAAQKQDLNDMSNFLISNQVTVGWLYSILMKYESKSTGWGRRPPKRISVFQFVANCVRGGGNSWTFSNRS